MNRFLVSLAAVACVTTASAAELPVKAKSAPAPAAKVSGLYLGGFGGLAFTGQQFDFVTPPGVAAAPSGTGKLYPAGAMAGVTLGFGGSVGSGYAALENELAYDFTQFSTSCMVGRCTSKNSVFLAQKLILGAPLPTLVGVIPQNTTLTPPSQWPIALAVPTNFSMAALMPAVVGGIAEHDNRACASLDGVNMSCGERWIAGPLVGLQLRFAAASNWSLKAEYDYIFFRHAFTAAAAVPLFGTYREINEQRLMMGVDYHL